MVGQVMTWHTNGGTANIIGAIGGLAAIYLFLSPTCVLRRPPEDGTTTLLSEPTTDDRAAAASASSSCCARGSEDGHRALYMPPAAAQHP